MASFSALRFAPGLEEKEDVVQLIQKILDDVQIVEDFHSGKRLTVK